MKTRFYIVRHGETEWNVKGILQGQLDSPLTQKGIEQAEELAKIFQNKKFDSIFSSDLYRAQHTAEIIAAKHAPEVLTTPLLREKTFGEYDGWDIKKYKKKFADLFKKKLSLDDEERLKFTFAKKDESDGDITNRFIIFLKKTANLHKSKNVLLVSHGGIMRRILIHFAWVKYGDFPPDSIDNLGYYVFESDGESFEVLETVGVKKKN